MRLQDFRGAGTSAKNVLIGRQSMSIIKPDKHDLEQVAGNGLINRRALLGRGMIIAGAAAPGTGASVTGAAAEALPVDPWSLQIGSPIPAYETPSKYEKHVVRTLT